MAPNGNDSPDGEERLDEVLADYLDAEEAGRAPDRDELLRRYPELRPRLARFFAEQDRFDRVAAPLRAVGRAAMGCASQSPMPERLGDFRILREVGRGGMGVVYEAEQMSLGRRVALKVLPFAGALESRQLLRFKNEAHAAAQLHHTNIVPVYFVGCERGVHFYAMQYIDGRTLAAVIHELRQASEPPSPPEPRPSGSGGIEPLPASCGSVATTPIAGFSTERSPREPAHFRAVARLGMQAAEALEYAHQEGVLHRDIKPANLLVDAKGKLWLTDFGLACFQGDTRLTGTGDLVGTLRYMSPEQALGQRHLLDHRTDIYSLGATLYELLTLRPVFEGGDRQELLRRIATDEPTPLRRWNPSIPVELETILLKAIAKETDARYATAQALADDLENFLENKPIRARRPTLWEWLRKWARRHRGVVATAIAAAFVVLLLAVVAFAVSAILISRERADALRQRNEAQRQEALALERERDLRHYLSAADMRLAHDAWGKNHLAGVWELLARHEPRPGEVDSRTFAWHYLWQLSHNQPPARVLSGHVGDAYHVCYAPDGKVLATSGKDGKVRLWDAATGKEQLFIAVSTQDVNWVEFTPDGKTLATADDEGQVKLWDPATGLEVGRLPGFASGVVSVVFSPDGRTLATGGDDGIVRLWDFQTRQLLKELKEHTGNRIEALAFSPDRMSFASVSALKGGVVSVYNLTDPWLRFEFFPAGTRCVDFSRPGGLLVCGEESGSIIIRHPLKGDEWQRCARHNGIIQAVAFSPDIITLACGGDNGLVRILETRSGRVLNLVPAGQGRIWSLAYAPDGKTLATTGSDGTIKLWDLCDDSPWRRILAFRSNDCVPLPGTPQNIILSPDCRRAALLSPENIVDIWDMEKDRFTAQLPGRGHTPIFSFDGRLLLRVTDRQTVELWEATTGRLRWTVPSSLLPVQAIALSPDGRTGLTVAGSIPQLWDTATGQPVDRLASLDSTGDPAIRAPVAAFSPDGQTLAITASDGVRLWKLATQRVRHTLPSHRSQINVISFSANGNSLVTGDDEGGLKYWDATTGQERTGLVGHPQGVLCAAISPDGKTLATGGKGRALKLWDLRTGLEMMTLEGHTGDVTSLIFAPDGQTLLSACPQGMRGRGDVAVWRAAKDAAPPPAE